MHRRLDSTLEEWKLYSITLNKDVTVKAPGEDYIGHAVDLDRDGNLIVERADNGQVERVVAGDVSIRPV